MCHRGRLANQSRISFVLWLDALSITTWMSNLSGTFLSVSCEQRAELRRPVRRHALADGGAGLHGGLGRDRRDEAREERRRSVTLVVVRAPLDLSRAHRQQRLRTIERLDLALFVDADDQRL